MHEDSSQRSSSNSATEVAWQLPEHIQIVDQVFLSLAWGGSATAEAVNDAAYTQHVLMQSAMPMHTYELVRQRLDHFLHWTVQLYAVGPELLHVSKRGQSLHDPCSC